MPAGRLAPYHHLDAHAAYERCYMHVAALNAFLPEHAPQHPCPGKEALHAQLVDASLRRQVSASLSFCPKASENGGLFRILD